jgi:hypothetical protein
MTDPTATDYPTRTYLMALIGRQRVPRRVPKSEWIAGQRAAREWWLVAAPNAKAARALIDKWPMAACDPSTHSRIMDHHKARN